MKLFLIFCKTRFEINRDTHIVLSINRSSFYFKFNILLKSLNSVNLNRFILSYFTINIEHELIKNISTSYRSGKREKVTYSIAY